MIRAGSVIARSLRAERADEAGRVVGGLGAHRAVLVGRGRSPAGLLRGHQAGSLGGRADHADAGPPAADDGELDGLAAADDAADDAEPRDRGDREAAHRVEAEQLRPPAGGGDVEVGDAPDAAVDVGAAVDLDRTEEAGNRARRDDGPGDRRRGGAGGAEDDTPSAGPVDADDPQAPVEAGVVAVDRPLEVCERAGAVGGSTGSRGGRARRGAARDASRVR